MRKETVTLLVKTVGLLDDWTEEHVLTPGCILGATEHAMPGATGLEDSRIL